MNQKTTEFLTEHFGFAPIAVIDDVINAVNEIMYKCTEAVEEYLLEQRMGSSEEIEVGIAKLETLLENSVDNNFDKLELYCLRNILVVPRELVEGGWIRLKYHEDVELRKDAGAESEQLDLELRETVRQIAGELKLKRWLVKKTKSVRKLVKLFSIYRKIIADLLDADQFKDLQPLDETLYYLNRKIEENCRKVIEINDNFPVVIPRDSRDEYLQNESNKLLKMLHIVGGDGGGSVGGNQALDVHVSDDVRAKLDVVS